MSLGARHLYMYIYGTAVYISHAPPLSLDMCAELIDGLMHRSRLNRIGIKCERLIQGFNKSLALHWELNAAANDLIRGFLSGSRLNLIWHTPRATYSRSE